MKRKAYLTLVVAFFVAIAAFADGGGGLFFGYQLEKLPGMSAPFKRASAGDKLVNFGAYGYGVSRNFVINGGFGMAYMDPENPAGVRGAFGGIVNGIRILPRPINISITSWTGVGGVSYGGGPYLFDSGGYFTFFEEIDLEIGFPFVKWMMPVLYIGYQVSGNLVPGTPFQAFLTWGPTIGGRFIFGDMY